MDKVFHTLIWVIQFIVGSMMLMAGFMKFVTPINELSGSLDGIASTSISLVYVTAVVDMLGGLGLLLPGIVRISPVLTVYAAFGIVMVMASAIVFHLSRGEGSVTGLNFLLLVLSVLVVLGRIHWPIKSRP